MKTLISLILLSVGCISSPPPKVNAPPTDCPPVVTAPPPTCEDKVMMMDDKGVTCPANTRATFPTTFGFLQPGKVVVLCQCK